MPQKILIIDDETDLTFLMEDILSRTGGYDVIVRNDGESGIEACRLEIPDVIICDYVMPGCNGNKVAATVKGSEKTRHIPIVLTSGLGGLICFEKDGAWDALQKQIDREVRQSPDGVLEWHELSPDIARALCFDYYFPKPFTWDALLQIMKHVLSEKEKRIPRRREEDVLVSKAKDKKVMIVEDEKDTAFAMKQTLERVGFIVCAVVSSGEDALVKAETLKPDVVLMDIELEGFIDGLTAGKEIKKKFNIPTVYMTGHEDRAAAIERFGREPLRKPFGIEELCAAIGAMLYDRP